MTRAEIQAWLLATFAKRFEIRDPGLDDDLRRVHEFDSIDAIELIGSIEDWLGTKLTQDEKKAALDIRTITHIIDYIVAVQGRIPGQGGVNQGE